MKKFFIIMMIALVAVASVFAAPKADTFAVNVGWDKIDTNHAVNFNVATTLKLTETDNFAVGVLGEAGVSLYADNDDAKFVEYVGPAFTFKNVAKDFDVLASVGARFMHMHGFFDVGVGGVIQGTYWASDVLGVTVGGKAARMLKTDTNDIGAYIGITCKL